ncbi:tyrosine-type recombinase/integrase [Mycobacterium simiae]|uniref:Tyrosine-type recombinase/integrase n=1 Tax=Mycobacterium simiae TaxID=1784 RepID=A0A5B1BDQ5_MYCSI|nr:tyrosine-type recombinase/integrase [Mycobacterium simiae]KAA1246648.1 tyrosine-type recombinase/integrase [Mycobacterium simiae]
MARQLTLGVYAEAWVDQRKISSRVRDHYRRLLATRLLPAFADTGLRDLSPAVVGDWYAGAAGPATMRIHAYALLRSVMQGALADGLIEVNPCQIDGVRTSRRAERVRPATRAEIETIAAAMPAAYQALILMSAWLAMPFSELSELRRKDVDLAAGVVRVRRAVTLVDGFELSTPKSPEGMRDIAVPAHLLPAIRAHLRTHVQPGRESLLFPSVGDPDRYLSTSVLYPMFDKARRAAGRPDLRVPDLRRSGAALASSADATRTEPLK